MIKLILTITHFHPHATSRSYYLTEILHTILCDGILAQGSWFRGVLLSQQWLRGRKRDPWCCASASDYSSLPSFVYEQTVGALDCQEQALVQLIFGLNDRWRHVCLGRTEKGPSHFQAVYPWWSTLCFRIKGLPFAGLPLEGNTDQPREWRSAENDQQGCAWRELYSCFCLAWGLVRSIKDVRKIASPDLHSYCCIDDSFGNLHCSQSPTKSPTG